MDVKALQTAIQAVMDRSVAAGEVAGANLLVLKDGEELLYNQSGYADVEEKKAIEKDSIFRLYSMSKPVTAAGVMLLMERGVIDLCDPVERYLPGFKNQKVEENGKLVPAKRPVTIRDLLSMTSGLPYGGDSISGKAAEAEFEQVMQRMDGDDPISTVEFANRLGSRPLSFQPGEQFMYGTSADILGAVIEVASGMRFGDFLKENFFDPLHMDDTAFYVPTEKHDRLAKTYETLADGTLKELTHPHLGISCAMGKDPAYQAGGAGLASTLPDYANFASMLIHQGKFEGKQILKPSTVRYMTTPTLLPWQQEVMWKSWDGLTGYSYGNLMRVAKDPGMAPCLATVGEYGWDGWLGAYFSNHPTQKLTILMGMQKKDAGTWALTRKLRNLILAEID